MKTPTISLVTPTLNSQEYLLDTLKAISDQSYDHFNHVIVDGGSSDNTAKIARKHGYSKTSFIAYPKSSMYEAIQRGFEQTEGEIMGWINSDDLVFPHTLSMVSNIFSDLPAVDWITGVPVKLNAQGQPVKVAPMRRYTRMGQIGGKEPFIQQESTFWRRSLWEKAGGGFDLSLKFAGDFELWLRFFEHAELYSANVLLGAFRKHSKQKTSRSLKNYEHELMTIREKHKSKISHGNMAWKYIKHRIFKRYFIAYHFSKNKFVMREHDKYV